MAGALPDARERAGRTEGQNATADRGDTGTEDSRAAAAHVRFAPPPPPPPPSLDENSTRATCSYDVLVFL